MTSEELEWSDYGREHSPHVVRFNRILVLSCVVFDIVLLGLLWRLLWAMF